MNKPEVYYTQGGRSINPAEPTRGVSDMYVPVPVPVTAEHTASTVNIATRPCQLVMAPVAQITNIVSNDNNDHAYNLMSAPN